MAIFKVPRISTAERSVLTLEVGEIVYDTDLGVFFGGNGVSEGGFQVGSGFTVETITLTSTNILNKSVTLSGTPLYPQNVLCIPEGGIAQRYSIDFTISANTLSWDALGLDGFLEAGETLTISY